MNIGFEPNRLHQENPSALAGEMAQSKQSQGIPTSLGLQHFDEFVLPHLTCGSRGPHVKLAMHKIFNYIFYQLYLGC
jgi:hypothetical protein